MAQHGNFSETNYPAQLAIDIAEAPTKTSQLIAVPITARPPIPIELANHKTHVSPQPAGTQATRAAAGNRLTAANLAKKDAHYDPDIHAMQRAARAHAVQKAGKEQGFDLPVERYTNDRQDLAGWLAQQSK